MDVSLEAEHFDAEIPLPQNHDPVGRHDARNSEAWHSIRFDPDALTSHDPLMGSWGFDHKSTRLQASRDTRQVHKGIVGLGDGTNPSDSQLAGSSVRNSQPAADPYYVQAMQTVKQQIADIHFFQLR